MTQNRFHGVVIGLLTLTLLLALTRTAHADGGEASSKATVHGYQIVLALTEPAKVGENEFHVQITDPLAMPVTPASIEVTARLADNTAQHGHESTSPTNDPDSTHAASDAPAHADMNMSDMEMSAETSAHDAHAEALAVALTPGAEEGEYAGEISLDKSGAWTFTVHFTVNGELIEAAFPVTVVEASQNLGVLAGFFGFNATVILTAAVLKRKAAVAA